MSAAGGNIAGTIISVIALAVGAGNYLYTFHLNKRIRRFEYRLNQWAIHRDEITREATLLRDRVIELGHADFSAEVDAARDRFRVLHRSVFHAHTRLSRALQKASRSSYASDEESWFSLAYEPVFGENTCADHVGELVNERLSQMDTEAAFEKLALEVTTVWLQMLDGIDDALRREAYRLDPNYHGHI